MRNSMTCLSAVLFASCGTAHAADIARPPAADPIAALNWTGFYLGAHLGAGFGTTKVDNPYGPSIYGDTVRVPKALAGLQAGYNWQAPGTAWVLGVEADASALDADGTDTCLAYSGQFVSANCRVREHVLGTLTGRIGHAFGSQGRSLMYVKGGAAFLTSDLTMTTNAVDYLNRPAAELKETRWGWTVGAGIEHALSSGWAVRAEYDYADFGTRGIDSPNGGFLQIPSNPNSLIDTLGAPTRARQDAHLIKLGLNYYFGRTGVTAESAALLPVKAPAARPWSAWQFDVGARYWYSHGRYQNDLTLNTITPQQEHLVSRLTYESEGHSGEVFWRIDSPRKLFVKGFAGGGGLVAGKMNDEDWFPTDPDFAAAYSNTYHGKVTGTIAYATLDAGIDLLGNSNGKIGVFAGYNFYRDRKDAFGCQQIALVGLPSPCSVAFPTTQIAISQHEDWHSLRIGANGSFTVAPGARLALDAAYLPYTHIAALDVHHNRTDVANKDSPAWGVGQGVQLEAILTYDVTPRFNVGVGGRYWAMWATDVLTAGFGSPVPTQLLPIRVERYGSFLQASYKFDVR
ncbi:outer membrane beta-barrel protein [Rhodopseudomonas pseudopalustris]|uniref:Opacity protein n=1 Tax=Rhodopseudomonas pseudopalustris TaxID=1513892 RepID=A0A1H8T5C0_9BRAD|nr:outer membrane beta-barrel protein [Rhodopseudomonas pseudopalustris]SEO86121.1 Opacity protein [Rhodopseudomonas pseudopalustris]